MNEMLKNNIHEIIQRQPNCSKLNFEIQITHLKSANAHWFPPVDFTPNKIDIICSNTNLDSFFAINDEIKKIYIDIENINRRYLINFIFEKCHIKFMDENINIDWRVYLRECNVIVNVQDVNIEEVYLLSKNFHNCQFEFLSLLREINIVRIDLNSTSIDFLQIVHTTIIDNESNKITLTNCEIKKIMIQKAIFKSDFTIHNTKINTIIIKNVDFEALSKFNEVTFQDEFNFKEITYKGFTFFDKCVFNTKAEFEYIIFEKFTSFRASTFNKGLNLDYTSSDKEINFFGINGLEGDESKNETSRETYRIIKNNFEKNGNKIEANKYHALELDQKRRELEKTNGKI